ncbi:MAG TPA: septum formation initiator family protein [Syntrophomonas sp.]|nr:septum formation initiator family protein [Syntrophomonas sp.]HPT69250.1 septum formation initiator family protein [Syntrophomonas sp.]
MKPNNKNMRLFISGLVCIVLLVTIVPRGKTILELSAQKRELKKQKVELQQIKRDYQKNLQELKTPEEIERLARERLGMVKSGEKVIIDLQQDN